MIPHAYLSIGVSVESDDMDPSAWRARGRLLGVLHGCFRQRPAVFAVGLQADPRSISRGLRVFASTLDDLVWLTDQLKSSPWIRDYAVMSTPRAVPGSFAGGWTSYTRYRIPTLNTDRKTGEEFGQLRARRLRRAAADGMDYFLLSSASTSQRFTLIVERQRGAPPSGECEPNSYGFSTTTRPFSLPDVE